MKPGIPFRLNSSLTKIVGSDKDEFDELVVGKWFHLEQMDTNQWWMRVGESNFDISIKNNKATIFHRESNKVLESQEASELYRLTKKEVTFLMDLLNENRDSIQEEEELQDQLDLIEQIEEVLSPS